MKSSSACAKIDLVAGDLELPQQRPVGVHHDQRVAVELDQAHVPGRAVVEALEGVLILSQVLPDAPLLGHVGDRLDPAVGDA